MEGGREREYFRISVITDSSQSMFNVELQILMNVHCLIAAICFAVLLFGFSFEKNYTVASLHAIFL